ncbi:MAG TPA: hypothetical protein VGO03_04595 [Acidimicrobiia bacterium]|jgi:hypothetical protein
MATDTPQSGDPTGDVHDDPPPNSAQDAQTIADVIRTLEADGYTGQFRAVDGGNVECFTCRQTSPAASVAVASMERLEGPTDPADMVAVAAISCPQCSARGTLLLGYGPDSSLEDAEALQSLGDAHN